MQSSTHFSLNCMFHLKNYEQTIVNLLYLNIHFSGKIMVLDEVKLALIQIFTPIIWILGIASAVLGIILAAFIIFDRIQKRDIPMMKDSKKSEERPRHIRVLSNLVEIAGFLLIFSGTVVAITTLNFTWTLVCVGAGVVATNKSYLA